MRKAAAIVVLAGGMLPVAGHATPSCASNVAVMSRVSQAGTHSPTVNAHPFACAAGSAPQSVYDTRIILPGATAVAVRYAPAQPPGPNSPSIQGSVSGLVTGAITLVPREAVAGSGIWVYESSWFLIAPTAQGTVTATVSGDTTTFHTVPGW